MERKIKKAVVLGAGVMGAGIAAHLANVGIPVYLLDIVPKELTKEEVAKGLTLESMEFRNRFAQLGKEKIIKAKPAALYSVQDADLITIGNMEDHLAFLKEADWIIEVVVENLQVKKQVLEMVEKYRKPTAIVSTNTSGVSINRMVEDRSKEFKQNFLGTHFFNPPRYMKLLEIIPGNDTDEEVLKFMAEFSEKVLGKGVVFAKDTPNFVANRIGTFGLMVTIHEMVRMGLKADDVDTITGPLMGRPKSASFRTLDMVGIDTFIHVAQNVLDNSSDEEDQKVFTVPEFLRTMVAKGWIGDKNKQGFYKKVNTDQGKEIFVLDYNNLEYVPKGKLKSATIELAKQAKSLPEKLRTLVNGKDKVAEFAWNTLKKVLLYSAKNIGLIADDIVNIDNAMKWGFNWELGPFEIWDAIGVRKSVARMQEEGEVIPDFVQKLLSDGKESFYQKSGGKKVYFSTTGEYAEQIEKREYIDLTALKEQGKVIKSNAGASLIDIGDDVALLEFHSPNNAIASDILTMINFAVDEVNKNYRGMVIGNYGKNFSVGANLMLILMEAQDENWDELDYMVRMFQNANLKLKYAEKPVVAAPHAMTLGGGAEVTMHSASAQLAAETYLGLVEVGVGLIPAGGGTKELLFRSMENIPADVKIDPQLFINKAFETIAMAKVSTSGKEAISLGYLRKTDGISINRDHQLFDAKQRVLALEKLGYNPPRKEKVRVNGETGYNTLKLGIFTFLKSGMISEHDKKIAEKIAYILSGGTVSAGTLVSEEYILDLEREAFLSLLGEPKTQARMEYMLAKGKPLRN